MQKQISQLNIGDFKRVAVIGCPGSGKTTLSKALAPVLGKKPVHLDKELWLSDWTVMPFERRQELHKSFIERDDWLIDGMWRSHVESRIARATLVVWLDFPTELCLDRVLLRKQSSGDVQRSDIADGCLENDPDSDFDAFINYIKHFNTEVRPLVQSFLDKNASSAYLRLTSPKQVDEFFVFTETLFSGGNK